MGDIKSPPCPHCGQPLPPSRVRFGVPFGPLKVRLVDAVLDAGPRGVSLADLNARCFQGLSSKWNVRTHVWQINEELAARDAGVRIRAHGRGAGSRYAFEGVSAAARMGAAAAVHAGEALAVEAALVRQK